MLHEFVLALAGDVGRSNAETIAAIRESMAKPVGMVVVDKPPVGMNDVPPVNGQVNSQEKQVIA